MSWSSLGFFPTVGKRDFCLLHFSGHRAVGRIVGSADAASQAIGGQQRNGSVKGVQGNLIPRRHESPPTDMSVTARNNTSTLRNFLRRRPSNIVVRLLSRNNNLRAICRAFIAIARRRPRISPTRHGIVDWQVRGATLECRFSEEPMIASGFPRNAIPISLATKAPARAANGRCAEGVRLEDDDGRRRSCAR